MKKFLLFVLLLSIHCELYSIDTVNTKYFPLRLGSIYVYTFTRNTPYTSYTVRARILRDTVINSKLYFLCFNFPSMDTNAWLRTDSNTANLLIFNPGSSCAYLNQETIIDSLASIPMTGGTICGGLPCTSMNTQSIFGQNVSCKFFGIGGGHSLFTRQYALNFGLISHYYSFYQPYYLETYILKGCVINGVLYGDTATVTGLDPVSGIVPGEFKLHQNYPNPFNPVTKIKFDIPTPLTPPEGGKGVSLTLKIYDVLGREIATLVNGQLKPGVYEVEWSASNYPSGVYFYQLRAGEYTETRKMVLIK